jgi:2-haloacid dehalogenase
MMPHRMNGWNAMTMERRRFLELSAVGAAFASNVVPLRAEARPRVKAIAFDGLAVFDPRPVALEAERIFPGKSAELMGLWRTRQFEYTWLRNSMGRYADFEHVTEDALRFAAKTAKLPLDGDARDRLMGAFHQVRAWSDVAPTLGALHAGGYRLALLSNFTAPMLDRAVANSGLEGLFEPHLSTDLAQVYKPDARAYRLALNAFALPREQIAFVAFAGWDAAGAKAFGFPTYWANRTGAQAEELGLRADAVEPGLEALPAFVG